MDLSTLSSLLENHALALEGLYRSLGADRAVVTVKLDELHQALIGTIQRQRTAAEQEVADVQRRVEELRSDIERNRRRLGEGRASCATDGETLLQTRVRLEKEAQVTEKVVQKRQKAIAALSDRLLALEAVVGQGFGGASYAHDTPTNAQAILPGSEQPLDLQTLANLEKAITKCENEVRHREELLQSLLREILDLWNELGLVPSSRSSQSTSNGPVLVTATASRADDLDHQILIALGLGMPGCESSTPKLTASRADTDRLENYKSELEAERDKRMLQIQTIYDELYLLWTRLGVSEDDADEFVEMWKGTEQKCIDAYRAELCRMLDVKAEHMGIFIQNEQQEIIALWEELFYADTDRARFPLMQAESASEDILIAHELERKRLVEEKQSKEPILRHLSRYFELLDEMQQLEANANDPSRLTAKGQRRDPGRLLREEKTRKRVAKDKPKLEQELLALIPAWEAQHNQAFMVNGSRFIEDLTARLNVEDAKASVNKSRTRHGSVTNLPGSRPLPLSAKRPLGVCGGPAADPASSTIKRPRTNSTQSAMPAPFQQPTLTGSSAISHASALPMTPCPISFSQASRVRNLMLVQSAQGHPHSSIPRLAGPDSQGINIAPLRAQMTGPAPTVNHFGFGRSANSLANQTSAGQTLFAPPLPSLTLLQSTKAGAKPSFRPRPSLAPSQNSYSSAGTSSWGSRTASSATTISSATTVDSAWGDTRC